MYFVGAFRILLSTDLTEHRTLFLHLKERRKNAQLSVSQMGRSVLDPDLRVVYYQTLDPDRYKIIFYMFAGSQ
jgi:hypothetical protein